MKILQLADKLKAIYDEHGDIDVMLEEHGDPVEANYLRFVIARDGDYPEEWNMPADFKFVVIR